MYNLDEEKVFRDPIAGYVRVNNEIVWRCIESREFQRLKRIKQLYESGKLAVGELIPYMWMSSSIDGKMKKLSTEELLLLQKYDIS